MLEINIEALKKIFSKRSVIALCAGFLLTLAFAPINFFLALPISFSIFYFLLEQEGLTKRKIFSLGFIFGFGHFFSGIYWIAASLLVDAAQFGWLVPFALTIIPSILAVYFGLVALSYKFLIAKFKINSAYQKILLFALLFVIAEILRSNLLSGFSWNLLGYTWMFESHFAQLGSVFGVYGLSFFAILVALLPTLFWKRKAEFADKIFAAFVLCFLFGNLIFGIFYIDDKKIVTFPDTKIRLVQSNVKQEIKWVNEQKRQNLFKHIFMSNAKNFDDIDVVIWAETSVPYVVNNDDALLEYLRQAIPNNGILITGGLHLEPNEEKEKFPNVWNSVFVVSQKGITQNYDKHHLVPFGEYVPFYKFLSFLFLDEAIDSITGGGSGFSEGKGAQTLLADNFTFSPLICYEVIFSSEVVDHKNLPDIFINVTNDAWFGKTSGPYQHFDMARMRAIEYGIPLIRVAGTGISGLVDPYGRVVAKIGLNKEGVLDVNLIKNTRSTIYAKYGHWPLGILLFLTLLILIVSLQRSHESTKNNAN